jgi:dolichyl-diphosphooligosaccharide--protein glycosyltransferase
MAFKKIPSWAIVLLLLIIIVAVALWLRVVLPYNQVFVGDWVKMTGVDAYYYMRLVDNLMRHFPQLTQFDPYLQYPGGAVTGSSPDFFAYFMGGIIWLLSLGKADQHTVDVIAVYIPPLLAVLTILAAFIIGILLGSKWLGLMSAGLLAIMPGEFLNRSLLGYTDHHIAEVMFSTGIMLFVFLAVRAGQGRRFEDMARGGWQGIGKPLLFSILAGLLMGLYMLTWAGALMFALIVFVFIVVQAVIDHVTGRPSDYLGILGVGLFGVALALSLAWIGNAMTVLALAAGLLISILLPLLSRWMNGRELKPFYYPLVIVGLAVLGAVLLALVSPSILQSVVGSLAFIFVWPVGTTVMEMQPLLIQQGNFTFAVALGNYMLAFFFSLICMAVLFYQVIKKGQPDKTLLLTWSIIILLSALSMRRFAYYFAVNVALLTGYLCWIPLGALIKKKEASTAAAAIIRVSAKGKKRAAKQARQSRPARRTSMQGNVAVVMVLVFIALLVYYPNIGPLPDGQKPAVDLATRPLFAPSNAWCEALDWLRTNTPEPFVKADAYYGLFKPVSQQGGFEYPAGSYGTLAWWDYGYWIARIGHRAPAANPGNAPATKSGTGLFGLASYFTAQDWPSAARSISTWGTNYVIVDNEIAAYDGKFHALATLSNSDYSKYYDMFIKKQGDQYVPSMLFYPEYYRCTVVRLYNFDGKAVTPGSVNVIAFREFMAQDGRKYKEIIENRKFTDYETAQQFIRENSGKNYFIAGEDPGESPVPLDELKGYRLVYSSNQKISAGSKSQPVIKIFEYKKDVIPLVGDWNGDKKAEVGLWQSDGYFTIDKGGDNRTVKMGPFGYPSDVPLAGDWNGDGRNEIGVWRPTDLYFYLDSSGDGLWNPDKGDIRIGPYGFGFDDRPVTGDWNGDGRDEVGVWHHGFDSQDCYFYLDISGAGEWDPGNHTIRSGPFGKIGDVPLSGDWNGDGRDETAIWEPAGRYFYLDMDRDGTWDAAKGDLKLGPYGEDYDTPVRGNWDGGNKDLVGVWDPYTRLFHLNTGGDGKWGEDSSNIMLNAVGDQ